MLYPDSLYLASSSYNILSFRLLLLAVAAAAAVIEKRTTQKAIEQAQQGSGSSHKRVHKREIVNEVQSSGRGPAAEAESQGHCSGSCSAGSCAALKSISGTQKSHTARQGDTRTHELGHNLPY